MFLLQMWTQSRKDPPPPSPRSCVHRYALKKQEEMTNKILLTLPLLSSCLHFAPTLRFLVVALFTSLQPTIKHTRYPILIRCHLGVHI